MTPVGFDRPPLLLVKPDGKSFQCWDPVVYTGSKFDSWTIPEGFTTDFATIPACVSWAIPKLGAYTLAAIVHDLLCTGLNDWPEAMDGAPTEWVEAALRAGGIQWHGKWISLPTADAVDTDALFYKIAREVGTDPVTAHLLWVGVRWGALANPARRAGWFRTAPAVLGWSLVFAPVLVPATVLAVVGQGILKVARWLAR